MLVCLYVSHSISESSSSLANLPTAFVIKWTRDEIIESLEKSFKIWDSIKCSSKEALKAAKALKTMLSKAQRISPTLVAQNPPAEPTLSKDVFSLPFSGKHKSGDTEITSNYSELNRQCTTNPKPNSSNDAVFRFFLV
jgi:hypothetical protein